MEDGIGEAPPSERFQNSIGPRVPGRYDHNVPDRGRENTARYEAPFLPLRSPLLGCAGEELLTGIASKNELSPVHTEASREIGRMISGLVDRTWAKHHNSRRYREQFEKPENPAGPQ
jgi:hypothetical protein